MAEETGRLVKLLKKLNRKERYWLLRNAIGEKFLQLDESFICELQKALEDEDSGIEIPKNAWWAMDYHLDWIAVALKQYVDKSEINEGMVIENECCTHIDECDSNKLISGNQLDIDMIIAYDKTLILVEAKADISWSRKQMENKIKLLDCLLKFVEKEDIQMYLVLCSPGKTKVHEQTKERSYVWPSWTLINNEKPAHIFMRFGSKNNPLYHPKRTESDAKLIFEKRHINKD